jgi:hypothetical protein
VDGGTYQRFIKQSEIGLFLEGNIGCVFYLHDAPSQDHFP